MFSIALSFSSPTHVYLGMRGSHRPLCVDSASKAAYVGSVLSDVDSKLIMHACSVNSIAKTAAWQLQRTDIRVNSICPGLIETGMTVGTFDYARARGNAYKIGQLNPMGRYGVAEGMLSAL